MRAKHKIVSSERELAEMVLTDLSWMNAVDVMVAALFFAAATRPEVFFGPVQILVGGPGVGLHAVDGRLRQPGRGAKRPRGYVNLTDIPDAARIAAPMFGKTLLVALATFGSRSRSLRQIMMPAIQAAKGSGREEFLTLFLQKGAVSLLDDKILEPLLDMGGVLAGGILTREDLSENGPTVFPAEIRSLREREVVTLPWSNHVPSVNSEYVITRDSHGVMALACYERRAGLSLGNTGFEVPCFAEPIRRGVPRMKPGAPLDAFAAMALFCQDSVPKLAFAMRGESAKYWLSSAETNAESTFIAQAKNYPDEVFVCT